MDEGIDNVISTVTHTLKENVESLTFDPLSGAVNGTGNALNNLIKGTDGNNILKGLEGNDILQGQLGADTLTDTSGSNLFDGGAGIDNIGGGNGNDLFVGNTGNDSISTGLGNDVILFNRGDGQDIVLASTGQDNIISLGKGIVYADLVLKKSKNDLILVTGNREQITFKDWYASTDNQSVSKIQIILEGSTLYDSSSTNSLINSKIAVFDFEGLVTEFAQSGSTSLAIAPAIGDFLLFGSDTDAFGGSLTYDYGRYGILSNHTMTQTNAMLEDIQFGVGVQKIIGTIGVNDYSWSLA